MKVKINTYGQLFTLFVDVPIRTPAVIEISRDEFKMLQRLAEVNGWSVEVVEEAKRQPVIKPEPKKDDTKKESSKNKEEKKQ